MPNKNKCIVCGKEVEYKETFPHGSFTLCPAAGCREKMTLQINCDSYPVIWVGREDLYNEDSGYHRMPKDEYDAMETEDIIEIAKNAADVLGDDFWGDTFDGAVKEALQARRNRIEYLKIKNTPEEDLPILVGTIEFPENQRFFENRLKGEA